MSARNKWDEDGDNAVFSEETGETILSYLEYDVLSANGERRMALVVVANDCWRCNTCLRFIPFGGRPPAPRWLRAPMGYSVHVEPCARVKPPHSVPHGLSTRQLPHDEAHPWATHCDCFHSLHSTMQASRLRECRSARYRSFE